MNPNSVSEIDSTENAVPTQVLGSECGAKEFLLPGKSTLQASTSGLQCRSGETMMGSAGRGGR